MEYKSSQKVKLTVKTKWKDKKLNSAILTKHYQLFSPLLL